MLCRLLNLAGRPLLSESGLGYVTDLTQLTYLNLDGQYPLHIFSICQHVCCHIKYVLGMRLVFPPHAAAGLLPALLAAMYSCIIQQRDMDQIMICSRVCCTLRLLCRSWLSLMCILFWPGDHPCEIKLHASALKVIEAWRGCLAPGQSHGIGCSALKHMLFQAVS